MSNMEDNQAVNENVEHVEMSSTADANQDIATHETVEQSEDSTNIDAPVDDIATVIDDPCWGSPTTCSLLDLLKLIKKDDVILYESSDYIVLRKPADLRMDGMYPATVHKLLTFWYPPRSLLLRSPTMDPKSPDFKIEDVAPYEVPKPFVPSPYTPQQFRLLERLATIPRHCDIKDNELRPCHQLDYATSGVLLVARSKETASRARYAFENRLVQKAYTAVLLGHINIPQKDSYFNPQTIEIYGGNATHSDHDWSNVTHRAMQATMEQMEYDYRKARQRHHKKTFHGFLPAHIIYGRWQDRQKSKYISNRKTNRKQGNEIVWNKKYSIKWDTIFAEVDGLSELVKPKLLNIKWEDLKNSESDLDRAIVKKFSRAADTYNNMARENLGAQKQKERMLSEALPTLPTFFRVKENPETDDNSFYIFAPLAQDDVTNNFAMLIHQSHAHLAPHLPVGNPTTHEFKPSLTSCTILQQTYIYSSKDCADDELEKIPVTVVQMDPKTGRRHQLRIHAALLGHPIAGDATYCNNESKERSIVDRLCLHSLSLKIPKLLPNEKDFEVLSENPFRVHQKGFTSFVTIDPL